MRDGEGWWGMELRTEGWWGMVRDGEGWNFRTEEWGAWGAHADTQTHGHTDTRTGTREQELVLENGPEKWFFWLFSTYMFLESWDQTGNESVGIFRIRGHLRSWEVIKGQTWKITEPRHDIYFWKPYNPSFALVMKKTQNSFKNLPLAPDKPKRKKWKFSLIVQGWLSNE